MRVCNKRMLCLIYDYLSAVTRTIYLVTMSKNLDCVCKFMYQFLTSEKLVIFLSNSKLLIKTLISNYELMRRAAKKTVVIIYGVMYTELCE